LRSADSAPSCLAVARIMLSGADLCVGSESADPSTGPIDFRWIWTEHYGEH